MPYGHGHVYAVAGILCVGHVRAAEVQGRIPALYVVIALDVCIKPTALRIQCEAVDPTDEAEAIHVLPHLMLRIVGGQDDEAWGRLSRPIPCRSCAFVAPL